MSLEGADFLPYAREMVAQEDAGLAALGLANPAATGTLRFAAPSSFAQLYIAPLLPEFLDMHPGINLDLRLSDTQFNLIEGSFDLALRNTVLEDSSLKGRKLADDTRVLCASPGYLARNGTPQQTDDLSSHQLIAFRDPSPRPLVGRNGEQGVFDPKQAGCLG